jgi:signal transduction histidine kinase
MSRALRVWLALIVLVLAATDAAAAEHRKVVILHSVGPEFRPWNEYAKQIRAELERLSPWTLDVREYSLESARSGDANSEPSFVQYLNALYADHVPNLVVAIGAPAAAFFRRHREHLFPKTPALFTAIDQRRINYSDITDYDALVAVKNDFRFLFESFLRISPDTRVVAVVNGNSPNELFWRKEIQKELKPLEGQIDIRWYDNLSFLDIVKETASLPPHSAIFWNTMVVDSTGVAYEGDRALTTLYGTANAPIFSHDDSFFGQEIVGGPMLSARKLSEEAGAVAVRLLEGEKPSSIRVEPVGFAKPIYDWRQLQRWGINGSRLPPDSEVYFRERTAWETYRWQIVLVVGVLLIQTALISGLSFERRRRLHAEVQSRQRMSELARVNRFSTAGVLTASIAHEINQPLGALRANAETIQLMMESATPDMDEIREIVTDIRRDEERASAVILRLRSLLKKTPFEIRDIDFNDVVRGTIDLVAGVATARQVEFGSSLSAVPLPVKGDPIQLQQVILNLIVNAMDATSDLPAGKRRVLIWTTYKDKSAEASIADCGPGIPPDDVKRVFDPLFTTKAGGMGMGLSIARTIVEAHRGKLSAENPPGGGALFRIELPLNASAD